MATASEKMRRIARRSFPREERPGRVKERGLEIGDFAGNCQENFHSQRQRALLM
jgi:hypothetical protein